MAELVVVSKERHAVRNWQRPSSFHFAANDAVVSLVAQEVPRAMLQMALGFMESNGLQMIVAVQGFRAGQNKYVSSDGRWLGDYIPAAYRTHPFKLARNQEGADVLCIDEQAGQVSENNSGESFFLPDGTPAPAVAEVLKILSEIEADRQRTRIACQTLAQHGLLEPWPLKIQDGEEILEAKGVSRISEAKLYALEPPALVEVRNSGGLMLAFAQLFSMQQIHKLVKLGTPIASPPAQTPGPKITEDNGIISFANL